MLSYRHTYHAGNLADVYKHSLLSAVIRAATGKPKPLLYLDTHAGAGRYDLTREPAAASGEYRAGIERLQAVAEVAGERVPDALRIYLDCVAAAQRDAWAGGYPGSASIASALLRADDRLVLAERHPADFAALSQLFDRVKNTRLVEGDGYALLRSQLPPPEGRGIVLIDPAYELDRESQSIITALTEAFRRFRHGTYLIWYPLVGKLDRRRFLAQFVRLDPPQTLRVELGTPPEREPGAIGSGMLIVNPPYSGLESIEAIHRFLTTHLGGGAPSRHEWLVHA